MRSALMWGLVCGVGWWSTPHTTKCRAEEPKPPVAPGANRRDEPLAKEFSRVAAQQFMASAAENWTNSHKCFTCHTNYAYLMARPALVGDEQQHGKIRAALEDMVEKRWADKGPRWDAEVVMSAAVLALNDAATTGKLHAATRQALDRMWTLQRADGGFNWLKCEWPPMESDDDFAIPMAALAAGAAPEGYLQTPAAREGVRRLRGYLEKHPPPTLHHRAMLLWASTYVHDLVAPEARATTQRDLRAKQLADGGWSASSLGNWTREDKSPQDDRIGDGYGTGFTVFVLRRSGIAADDPALQSGVKWLKTNQRESGRWFTRSLFKDSKHYLSHAGTAYALLAIAACEPASPPASKK